MEQFILFLGWEFWWSRVDSCRTLFKWNFGSHHNTSSSWKSVDCQQCSISSCQVRARKRLLNLCIKEMYWLFFFFCFCILPCTIIHLVYVLDFILKSYFRLAISENGCNAILEHENSQHILSKLVQSLGVDEAGRWLLWRYWFSLQKRWWKKQA